MSLEVITYYVTELVNIRYDIAICVIGFPESDILEILELKNACPHYSTSNMQVSTYVCTEIENFDNDKFCSYDYTLLYCKQTSNSFNDYLKWDFNGHDFARNKIVISK